MNTAVIKGSGPHWISAGLPLADGRGRHFLDCRKTVMTGPRSDRDPDEPVAEPADEIRNSHYHRGDHRNAYEPQPHVPHALSNRLPSCRVRLPSVLREEQDCR